jgi:alpha-beta hydrolase superfamily lysophospholipase
MDGTGELFSDFISNFENNPSVISLPQYGPQEHENLAKIIEPQLPKEDYILLAESFSGGIVPKLLACNSHHIKGIIFVASFLSCPNKFLLQIAKYLPLKTLASVPFSEIAHKLLFLGQEASHELLSKFRTVTNSIPEQVLKDRLTVMSCQELPLETFDIPVAYIQANSDKLISTVKSRELSKVFKNIEYFEIDGPHFILQSKPNESAKMVLQAIHSLINKIETS